MILEQIAKLQRNIDSQWDNLSTEDKIAIMGSLENLPNSYSDVVVDDKPPQGSGCPHRKISSAVCECIVCEICDKSLYDCRFHKKEIIRGE